MSERFNVRVDTETKEKAEIKANEEGISLAAWIRNIIIREVSEEKIIDNVYAFLDEACALLRYLEEEDAPLKKGEGYYCLKRAPKEDKLGRGTEIAAKNYCEVCQIREGALEDSRILKTQRLKGIEIRIPICTKGGTPSDDLASIWCPDIGRYRPIDEKERKTDFTPCRLAGKNNANCTSLKRKTVITGKNRVKDERELSK